MKSLRPFRLCHFVIFLSAAISTQAADPFSEIIRSTEALTPQEQLKTFHLPPGFEIQLVASEPEISKPMNIEFDAKGRLWFTESREYPFPVLPVDKGGRDKIMVLDNFDANGKAQKITTFIEGLNIPIGLYPYKDGVVGFSIPKVRYFQDTDGDGKSDKDDVLLTGFGYEKDTHGLTSHFSRGYDGWIYADHGFNNDSQVRAKDGSEIKMNSGNTYRFMPDGSHVEQFSWGQVNPFGLMFDHLGDLWASDCHSSPVYMLLRGAYYPSFGKPHDGLGFAPNICDHAHASTAIAGMVFYAATNFPAEYQNNTFIGNVMTCRINRDSYIENGSSRIAKEEPDFLSSTDSWFRPVDVKLGPDGALYIADFYNRIIGHYEVPLTHPGRDRERGRIWRVVYKGTNAPAGKSPLALPTSVKGLIAELGNANLVRRMLAMNELVDRIGKPAIKPVQKMMRDKKANAFQKLHGLWILQRLSGLDEKTLEIAAHDSNRDVRVHAMRVLSEIKQPTAPDLALGKAGLSDSDAYVQRAAADALGQHPQFENIAPLLKLRAQVSPKDQQLLHVVRMSLRNQLLPGDNFARVMQQKLSDADSRAIAGVAVGVKTAEAGQFLLKHMETVSENRARTSDFLRHAARFAPESEMGALAKLVSAQFANDLDFQLTLFKSVQEGTAQRGAQLNAGVLEWGADLAGKLITSVDPNTLDWRNSSIKGNEAANPWVLQERQCADGKTATVISSFAPGGEKLTGILRSKTFKIPAKLSFYLCGHDGTPDQPARNKNLIRILDAETKTVLAKQNPPRNDTAQLITWDLSKYAGKTGYIEIVDNNNGSSFAWIAAGRFSPEVVPMPEIIPNQVDKRMLSAAELAEMLRLKNLEPELKKLVLDDGADVDARAAAIKALVAINSDSALSSLAQIVSDGTTPVLLRQAAAKALATLNSTESRDVLIASLQTAPQQLQNEIALALAGNPDGVATLLQAVEQGKASARLLLENAVKERLVSAKGGEFKARLEKLSAGLTPVSVEKQKLIDERRAKFIASETSATAGEKIFTQNCAVCHQLGRQGALVGPQLDGVGSRGADRVIEDILDPNRNVDHAFRYSTVTLKDDQIITGLFRREEGETVVFANATGKEVSVAKKDILERRESENSLMPDNFSELIPEKDFYDLIAFLTAKAHK